ncbi:DinB/UmuC family translesion DNA polymerase [Limosilactobacillus sp.]|uniref:Y-family DNA polymerase n=1 Tax=Limosilactobacillus sp. TaxID=2773925 RepID=UPI003F1030C1
MARTYLAIDLKSFYASAECAAHHLNPLTTNLVVADESRTSKTICLAVSPALKRFGVPGRPRLFEVEQIVGRLNRERAKHAPGHRLNRYKSVYRPQILKNPRLKIGFKIVPPRMSYYLQKSAEIYEIYLRYLPPEKIHPYSIDEVLMDVTDYLAEHQVSAHTLAKEIIQTIQLETKITATAGIGTNLYLAKVAMDIVAKRIPADKDGVRIAQMDEMTYRHYLWAHQPLTDFWRVGRGYAKRLAKLGLYTMGDIARCSLGKLSDPLNEEVLYQEFGKNAELLIDHAWGFESTTMEDIKNYRSDHHGIYSSIVLPKPYRYSEGRLVVREMVDMLSLQMVKRDLVADQFSLSVNYDVQSLHQGHGYHGATTTDFYGREVPHPDHGSFTTKLPTASPRELTAHFLTAFREKVNPDLFIRRVTVTANNLIEQEVAAQLPHTEQLDLFTNTHRHLQKESQEQQQRLQDQRVQKMVLQLQDQFGKNAIIRAADLKDGAVAKKRNKEIGGHRA